MSDERRGAGTDGAEGDPLAAGVARRGAQALARLAELRALDPPTTGGRVLSYVYDSGLAEVDDVAVAAAAAAHGVNGLDPTVFGSVATIHREIVDTVRRVVSGGTAAADVFGVVTAGGTESCLLACLGARDVAARGRPGGGTIVAPVTAHAAYRTAAHVLGMGFVGVAVDPATGRVAADDLLGAVDDRTALVVCSAPAYPTGAIDPVGEVAAGLEARGCDRVGLHVDACVGGLVLPFWPPDDDRRAPEWDLRIPRVTSMSVDVHKYGFAPKGTSVLLSRGRERHRASWFATVDWPGYPVVNPTLAGSKPLEPAAAAWAVLAALADEGQRELVARTARATRRLAAGLDAIDGLRVAGADPGPLVAVVADRTAAAGGVHPHRWADACGRRGIAIQSQPALRQARGAIPSSAHLTVTPVTEGLVDEILAVARAAADDVRGLADPSPPAALAGIVDAVDRGELGARELLEIGEDDVHGLVAAVLAGGADDGEGADTGSVGGMAGLLAVVERLSVDVGARLVRAYLAAVLE